MFEFNKLVNLFQILAVFKIAKEFIDRLERVVHVKKVKNNVLSSIS